MTRRKLLVGAGGGGGSRPFVFRVTNEARQYLLREGTDIRYGARHLKRAIERHLVQPMSNLIATEQVRGGDWIRAQNIWRRWMVADNMPRPDGQVVVEPDNGAAPIAARARARTRGWASRAARTTFTRPPTFTLSKRPGSRSRQDS